jgi:lipoprotein-releasing system ATP-binding protein
MLCAESISKSYATRAGDLVVLRNASLRLDGGHSAAIVGPSGCGKSTLLNILGTLEPPTSGKLRIGNMEPARLNEAELANFRNRKIGFVFQEHHLLPQCSVLENVLIPTLVRRDRQGRLDRARELLRRVGLGDRLEHSPAEISGGERQRVAIARALVNEPMLLLADEPTGNLDRRTADAVADLLLELQESEGFIMVVVTHSERIAARFGQQFELVDGSLSSVQRVPD